MKTFKAIFGVALIFLFGAVFGAMNGAKWMERQFRTRIAEGPPAVTEMVTRRLVRSLSLTPEQGAQVKDIVLNAQQRLTTLRGQQKEESREIVRDAQTSIRAVLKAEQARDFERIVEESAGFSP